MREIPQNWTEVTLGDIGAWGSGGTPLKRNSSYYENGTIPWLVIGDLNDGYITSAKTKISQEGLENSSAKLLPVDTLLIAMYGSIGKLGINKIECATNQAIAFCIPDNSITVLKYLFYSMMYEKFSLIGLGQGGAQQNISQGILKSHKILLSPLAEQKRIADKLDTLLARVEAARGRLDRIPIILKQFRQAVLMSGTNGKLTEAWRKENLENVDIDRVKQSVSEERGKRRFKEFGKIEQIYEDEIPFEIPPNWEWVRLGDISLKITDGAHNTPKVQNEGYPFLMAKDLTGGDLDFSEGRLISEKDHRELFNKCQPEIGDLLVVNIGAGTGNNVSINVGFEFSFKNIAIIKRSKFVQPEYLKWFFDSRKQVVFREQTRGGAQPFLSLTILNNLVFALPPIEEQEEIVRRVKILFSLADKLEARYKAARAQIDNLTPSLLSKAFRGELVEQDPNDEPAEKLLERIQADRGKIGQVKKLKPGKRSAVKKESGISMRPNSVISVKAALEDAGKTLSGQELLLRSGYPADANTETIEQFFLDIRSELKAGTIIKKRSNKDDQDWFSLV